MNKPEPQVLTRIQAQVAQHLAQTVHLTNVITFTRTALRADRFFNTSPALPIFSLDLLLKMEHTHQLATTPRSYPNSQSISKVVSPLPIHRLRHHRMAALKTTARLLSFLLCSITCVLSTLVSISERRNHGYIFNKRSCFTTSFVHSCAMGVARVIVFRI